MLTRLYRTEPAVDFDAYEAISTHSPHYSPPYFSLVKFIFFNCVLIFLRLRGGRWWSISFDDFGTIYLQLSRKRKAIHNDEIRIMIAGYTHAWAEIRATYGWYSRTEGIFVECKIEKTSEWIRTLLYKGPHQLCFISRDQILASPKRPLPGLHRVEVSDLARPIDSWIRSEK